MEGSVGDVCVLDADLSQLDPHDFVDVPINATVFAGEVVFERSGSGTALAAAAAARSTRAGADEGHGMRCYEGGTCCCLLTEQIRAGRI